jgi:hypothetical protein
VRVFTMVNVIRNQERGFTFFFKIYYQAHKIGYGEIWPETP